MDEEKKVETPTLEVPKEVVTPIPEVKPKKKTWLLIIVIALAVIFTLVAGYIIYKKLIVKPIDTTNEEEVINEENSAEEIENGSDLCALGDEFCFTEETEVSEENIYTGEVITATLPEGWSIVEYFDGDGTESLPDMGLAYSGLTALDIINPENKQVFTLQAVSGIGFEGCPNYPLFDDDSPSYHAEQESASTEMGETLNTTDYTGSDYEEFEWLGVTFRRIDDKYFYDTKEGNNYFEPPCVDGLLTLEGLYFTDEDGYKYEAYFYGPTDDATEDDLVIVDQILESME
ncbi:MAG: hypothetical protein PHP08_04450, partial [Candidatus Dojkabacteria bacterium]|nr:hypothetical protein [Candidatus Dojkabacteria bacterium]